MTVLIFTLQQLYAHNIIQLAALIMLGCVSVGNTAALSALGSYEKVLVDVLFFALQIFCFCLIFLYAIPYFEKQKLYQSYDFFLCTTSRSSFFWQTVTGFFSALGSAVVVFYGVSVVVLYYLTDQWFWHILPGFIGIGLECMVLLAAAFFFSLLLSVNMAYLATFSFYAIAYTNHTWYELLAHKEGIFYVFGTALYYCFPDLALIDIKNAVVHQLPLAMAQLLYGSLYAFCYALLLLQAAHTLFIKKYW
ncbi:MAG: hypothetical protein AB7R69_03795 [Candidatus Babeliales bacterium]